VLLILATLWLYNDTGGPYPVFQGHTPPPAPASSISAQVTGSQPPSLNAQDKAQFTRLFVGAGPENGLLSSNKAQGIFVKSGLPTETLAKAWNLADTQQRGSLDLTDFIIGMYYLQSLMAGSIKDLPIALPPGLYEQASGGRPKPSGLSGPTSPIARQMTGSPARMPAQLTGSGIMQPQRTGQSLNQQPPARQYTAPPAPSSGFSSAFTPKPAQSAGPAWDVTPEAKAASDRFFDGLDTARKGFIEGDIAVPFLMQSGLPETDLAQVW
jgi:epidermal growth factor receptor substrate 15